jgi:accessory colonization factor AcfC
MKNLLLKQFRQANEHIKDQIQEYYQDFYKEYIEPVNYRDCVCCVSGTLNPKHHRTASSSLGSKKVSINNSNLGGTSEKNERKLDHSCCRGENDPTDY